MASVSQEYLFIGGCAGGRRLVMPDDLRFVDIPKVPKMPDFGLGLKGDEYAPAGECDVYRLVKMKGERRNFFVYALNKMSTDEILSGLLDCYKP